MKKFLFSWFAGMLVILIFCFLVIGVPTLIGFIGLPDWVVFAYFFVFGGSRTSGERPSRRRTIPKIDMHLR